MNGKSKRHPFPLFATRQTFICGWPGNSAQQVTLGNEESWLYFFISHVSFVGFLGEEGTYVVFALLHICLRSSPHLMFESLSKSQHQYLLLEQSQFNLY